MTRQQSLIVTALIAALLTYGFYAFALKPKRSELDTVGKQLTEQQAKLAQAKALLETNTAAKASYRADYATVVRLGKAVPSDDDLRSLVVQLSAAARTSRIDFSTLNVTGGGAAAAASATTSAVQLPPGATVGTAGFPTMPFSFTFSGKFFRLSDFFARLDDFVRVSGGRIAVRGRLLTINGIKLEPDGSGFPAIKATVDATSYLTTPLESVSATTPTSGAAAATTTSASAATAATTTATSTGAVE